MAGSAPNFASVFQIQYTSAGLVHTMSFRPGTADGAPTFGLLLKITNFFAALAEALPNDLSITGAQRRAQGADFFVPEPAPATSGLHLTAGWDWTVPGNEDHRCGQLRFGGKTTAGNQVHLTVFGANRNFLSYVGRRNDRVDKTEDAKVAAALVILGSMGLSGADRMPVTWRDSATRKINDFWRSAVLL